MDAEEEYGGYITDMACIMHLDYDDVSAAVEKTASMFHEDQVYTAAVLNMFLQHTKPSLPPDVEDALEKLQRVSSASFGQARSRQEGKWYTDFTLRVEGFMNPPLLKYAVDILINFLK